MINFDDANAFIVGGSKGIGLSLSRMLAGCGSHVTIFARNEADLREAAETINSNRKNSNQAINWKSVDVTNGDQVETKLEATVSQVGPPDLLINSAGMVRPDYFENIDRDQFERTLRVNLHGIWNVTSVLYEDLKRTEGHIVNVSSVAGFMGIFGYTDYCASKFGVIGLSEALRSEAKQAGVDVSVVCPPDTDTPGYREENKKKPPETKRITNQGGLLSADDVAASVLEGIRCRKFMIVPGTEGRLSYLAKRYAPGIMEYIFDRIITDMRDSATEAIRNDDTDHPYQPTAFLATATGVGLFSFWTLFFTVGLEPDDPPRGYHEFERAFPYPDSVLAVSLLMAGCLLKKRRLNAGRTVSLASGGALVFLGILDVSFNLQNGMYSRSTTDGVMNGLLNTWSVGFGSFLLWRFW